MQSLAPPCSHSLDEEELSQRLRAGQQFYFVKSPHLGKTEKVVDLPFSHLRYMLNKKSVMADPGITQSGTSAKGTVATVSDGDIADFLMEGRRVLPSQKPKTIEAPELPLIAELERSGTEFTKVVESARPHYSKLKTLPAAQQIDSTIQFTQSFAASLQSLMSAVHAFPSDSPTRPKAVGENLLPFAIAFWNEYPPSDDGSLIFEFHRQQQPPTDSPTTNVGGAHWVKGAIPFFHIAQTGKNLPGAEEYIAASKSMSPRLKAIREEISGFERKIANVIKTKEAAKTDDEYSTAVTQLSEAESNLVRAQQRIAPLLELVRDVKLSDVPAALNAINIRLAPKEEIWKSLCQAAQALERTIYLATYAGLDKRVESQAAVIIPWPTSEGKIRLQKLPIEAQELKNLGKDPERLARAVTALKTIRDALHTVYGAITETADLASSESNRLKESLLEPISHLKSGAKLVLRTLIESKHSTLSLSAMRLLETPSFEKVDAPTASPVLEWPRSFDLLTSVTSQFLHADDSYVDTLRSFFKSQPRYTPALGILEFSRQKLLTNQLGELAEFLDEQLRLQEESPDTFNSLIVLATLEGLTFDENLARELRYQIPNLSVTKNISKVLINENPEFEAILPDCVHKIVCTFSQSLRDYYSADKDGRLRDAVDLYRFYLRNRGVLKGIPANHALKNSVAIFGPPGVGKTFFAHCLENELDDVTLEVISPGEKSENQDRLAYMKSIIEKVKERETPTLLLLDEAETTAFDRMSELATSEDRACTNYLLQVVDDLRKNYPRVFILIASNYPERVDEAMVRPGRVDIIVYLNAPGPEERDQIFRSTLKKENIPLQLTKEQRSELIELTEGFIPIQIIQSITETERLYIPYMRSRGKEIVWSFELLKSRIEMMAHDDRLRKEKRKIMAGSHLIQEVPPP